MRASTTSLAAACAASLLLALPAHAAYRLPDRHGGEMDIAYGGHGKNWTAELNGTPGSRTIYSAAVVGRAVCRKPGSTWRGGWMFLISRRVKFDSHGRLTYRPKGREGRTYHRVWKLRLSPDGERLSGTVDSHWRSNAGEACRGSARFSARHVVRSTFYHLGSYAGTTSQGLPVSFRAVLTPPGDKPGDGAYVLRDVSAGVRLACSDGTSIDRTVSVQPYGGEMLWPLIIGGKVDTPLESPSPAPRVSAEFSLTFAHDKASGTLRAEAFTDGADGSTTCESGPLTFAVSRTGN